MWKLLELFMWAIWKVTWGLLDRSMKLWWFVARKKSNWPSVEVIDWLFEKTDHEVEAMGGLDEEARKFFPMLLAPL